MSILPTCMHTCLSDACAGQKKAFLETVGPLRLELLVIVSHHAGSGTSLWYAFYKFRSIKAFAYAQDCNVIFDSLFPVNQLCVLFRSLHLSSPDCSFLLPNSYKDDRLPPQVRVLWVGEFCFSCFVFLHTLLSPPRLLFLGYHLQPLTLLCCLFSSCKNQTGTNYPPALLS